MLNLKKLSDRLDNALSNETPESLNDWLNKKRSMDVKEFLKTLKYNPRTENLDSAPDGKAQCLYHLNIANEAIKSIPEVFHQSEMIDKIGMFIEEAVNEKLNGGWVRVEDRLPNSTESILVTDGKVRIAGGYYPEGDKFCCNSVDMNGVKCCDIDQFTHWQPLPKLPGE